MYIFMKNVSLGSDHLSTESAKVNGVAITTVFKTEIQAFMELKPVALQIKAGCLAIYFEGEE